MSKIDLRPTVTVALNFPISADGQTHDKLTMRRPKTADTVAASRLKKDEVDRALFLMSRLCDVSPEAIEELDESDFYALNRQLDSFRGTSSAM